MPDLPSPLHSSAAPANEPTVDAAARPTADQPSAARRAVIRNAALLVPTVITVFARPAWAAGGSGYASSP